MPSRRGAVGSTRARIDRQDSLAQVVEHHDVGVHVEQVVGVGRVVVRRPGFGLWTLVGEHVVAVLGLVVHAVKSRHLDRWGRPSAVCDEQKRFLLKYLRILGRRARLYAGAG